jgi:hypothetical protein
MFARILANTADTNVRANPNLTQEKQVIGKLWSDMAAAERWLQLPTSSVAIVAGASPNRASEVLRSRDDRQPSA